MNKIIVFRISTVIALSMIILTGFSENNSSYKHKNYQLSKQDKNIDNVFLKVTVGGKECIASFVDSETTRSFIKLLPLTLTMDDIGKREKYSGLPHELVKGGTVKNIFQKGDISYWLGGGLAAFYNQDDHEVKAGLIVLARLEKGIDLFNVPGSVTVTFEAIKK